MPHTMKYRPSNGTEGDCFFEKFCDNCQNDSRGGCEIQLDTMVYDLEDEQYPCEWTYDEDGPVCTSFKRV